MKHKRLWNSYVQKGGITEMLEKETVKENSEHVIENGMNEKEKEFTDGRMEVTGKSSSKCMTRHSWS